MSYKDNLQSNGPLAPLMLLCKSINLIFSVGLIAAVLYMDHLHQQIEETNSGKVGKVEQFIRTHGHSVLSRTPRKWLWVEILVVGLVCPPGVNWISDVYCTLPFHGRQFHGPQCRPFSCTVARAAFAAACRRH